MMRSGIYQIKLSIFTALITVFCATSIVAQSSTDDPAAELRSRLSEVQEEQAELQAQLTDLDEQLKPENIEMDLAGVGTTHPEELREQRRRQLEAEKSGVCSRLDQLNTSQTRLEAAIARSDAASYQLNAGVTPVPSEAQDAIIPMPNLTVLDENPRLGRKRRAKTQRQPKPDSFTYIPAPGIE